MKKMNPNQTARTAGILYLLLIPLGIFGILYIPSTLIVPGDLQATADKIMANEFTFRLSIISALLVQLINIFLVLFLYKLLKPVNKNHAVLMLIFILIAVPIAFINEANYCAVLLVLNSGDPSLDLMSLFLELHQQGISIVQIFWGLWLFPMGYLVFKSGFLPKFIGILLMIGCFGYMIDSVTFLLYPNLDFTVSEFTFIGEVLLPLWLVIKGVKSTSINV